MSRRTAKPQVKRKVRPKHLLTGHDTEMFSLKMSAMYRGLLAAAAVVAALLFVAQVGWTLFAGGSGPIYVSESPAISLPLELTDSWRKMPVQFGRVKPLG